MIGDEDKFPTIQVDKKSLYARVNIQRLLINLAT